MLVRLIFIIFLLTQLTGCYKHSVLGDVEDIKKDLVQMDSQLPVKHTDLTPAVVKNEVVSFGFVYKGKMEVALINGSVHDVLSALHYDRSLPVVINGEIVKVYCHSSIPGRYVEWTIFGDMSVGTLVVRSQASKKAWPKCSAG